MIYTSGSTGRAEGVVITQRNICHFLRSASDVYGLGRRRRVPGSFGRLRPLVEEIWIPLMMGATLHVATPAIMGDVENLPDLLEKAGVTVLHTVPTLLGCCRATSPAYGSTSSAARLCWWR